MNEPDLMFLDPATILFYTLCTVSFLVGVWLVGWLAPARPTTYQIKTRIPSVVFILVPLLLATIVAAVSALRLLEANPAIILLLLSQQASGLKSSDLLIATGNLTFAPLMLTAVVWWAFRRVSDLHVRGWKVYLIRSGLIVAALTIIAYATLIISRPLLMTFVIGFAIVYCLQMAKDASNARSMMIRPLIIAASIPLLFSLFSFLRGTNGWEAQLNGIVGYSSSSYNRLAAILNQDLRYPYAGRGVYLIPFVSFSHAFNSLIPLNSLLGWPEYTQVWSSEFSAVSCAGLGGGDIWSGAFGYIYSDLGWFSPVFVFGYGLLYGVVWRSMKRGNILGVVLYPCFGFCIIFWMGSNYVLDSQTAFLFVGAVILAIYERILVKPSITAQP